MSYNGYGHVVESCPHNETEVTAAGTRLNCTEDTVGHNLYTCVPKFDLTSLVEFCYNATGKVSPFPKDHCLRIQPSGVLQSYSCRQFTEGCPSDYYLRSHLYQFPACSQIKTEHRCLYADPSCPNETVSYSTEDGAIPTESTTLMNVLNTTANVSSTSTTPVEQGSVDVGMTIGIVAVLVVICIVLVVVFWKRMRRYSPVPVEDLEMTNSWEEDPELAELRNNVIGEYSTWRRRSVPGNMPPKRKSQAQGGNPTKKRSNEDAGPLAPGTSAGTGGGDYVVEDKWECFCYSSDSERYRRNYRSKECIYYRHWLPKDIKDLLPQELPAVVEELPDFYEEFDTLIHTTTLQNALEIFPKGFKPRPVADSSVVNDSLVLMNNARECITPRPRHPLSNANVLWYGPCTFKKLQDPTYTVKRYGNVVFSMKTLFGYEGLNRPGLNLYFIEVIEYMNSTACRILVTRKDHPTLRKYDPEEIGGPLYLKKNRFYSTNRLKRRDGRVVDNVLEIMQEESRDKFTYEIRRDNHRVSFFHCLEPRKSVEHLVESKKFATEDAHERWILRNILKLAMVLPTLEPHMNVKLLTPFDSEQTRDERLRKELGGVHEEALNSYIGEHSDDYSGRQMDIFHLRVHGVVHELMSKINIVHTYLEMLHLVPQRCHVSLPDEIWNRISKVFSKPIEPRFS